MLRTGLWYKVSDNSFRRAMAPPHPGKIEENLPVSNGMFTFRGMPTMFGNAENCDSNGENCKFTDVQVMCYTCLSRFENFKEMKFQTAVESNLPRLVILLQQHSTV